ncbi:hypothetical protein OEZ85_007722 [Tetradesmus obliquus]|uniref:Uncharacterized protein n=1 Tax=Tetradesmus obliquus TaxID=3088 RepID=A0ABY8TGT5_TETOB|nr:hypothetical protein OEZ85_007722 [Tetradesmus obliquus]
MAPQQHLQRLPRPTSMLFDLEMEEVPGHQHELDAEGLQAVQAVSNLVSRAMTAASQAVRDVESACQSLLSQAVLDSLPAVFKGSSSMVCCKSAASYQ